MNWSLAFTTFSSSPTRTFRSAVFLSIAFNLASDDLKLAVTLSEFSSILFSSLVSSVLIEVFISSNVLQGQGRFVCFGRHFDLVRCIFVIRYC